MPNNLLSASSYFFNPYAIPPMVVGVLIFTIGFFVLLQNKKSPVNIAFFLQCLSVAAWISTISLVYLSRSQETALVWYRYITFFGVVNIMPSFALLGTAWSGRLRQRAPAIFLNYAVAYVFYALALATDTVIDPGSARRYFWGFYPVYKPLAAFFILAYLIQCGDAFRILADARAKERVPIRRTQIKTITIATLIAVAASIDFIPKFFQVPLYPAGYIPIFIYVCLVAYSIVRYRMFDIETAVHKTFMWLVSFSLIIVPMLAVHAWATPYIEGSAGMEIILWVINFLIFALYLRVVQPKIDHFFQRRRANLEAISDRFTEDLVHLRGLNQLIKRIEGMLAETLYPQKLNISIYRDARSFDNNFLRHLVKNNRVAYEEFIDIDPAYASIKDEARAYFKEAGAVVIIPLVLNDVLLGVISLGRKSTLRRYTGAEFHFLTVLKNQATIAISNSLLYENMEERVRQRTEELVQVQRQLVQAEKLATVGTLAGGVAHEINNPLTAILTNVQMLLASDDVDDKLDRESLELIEEATKRCRTIVKKLMTYARKPLETTQMSVLNLSDALKNVISFIGYQLEQDNIRLQARLDEDGYFVIGNQNELEQVLTNIILNGRDAIKKIRKGGTIEIAFSRSEDQIRVEISDEGEGIPDTIASKIFDPFFTTKDVGSGTGLGLSISQAIIEKHNGQLTFRSKTGEGSTFVIQLPVAEQAG